MLKRQADKLKEARQQKFLDDCRKRLAAIAEQKMKTTFIGALDSIEKTLGYLWGKDVDEYSRTEEQEDMYELWQELRTEILNNGNTQCRALLNEIGNHIIEWKRYNTTFKIVN